MYILYTSVIIIFKYAIFSILNMELQTQQQVVLFMDPLDLWLQVLGVALLLIAYWVYRNFVK